VSLRPSARAWKLAGAHPRRKPDPFQHRCGRHEHALRPQIREHGLQDRLAAISRPRGIGADLQTGAPVRQAEAAQAKQVLQLDRMLPSRLVAQRVISKGSRRRIDLARDEGDHRPRRLLAKAQTLARMPQQAKLNRESQSIAAAPFGPHKLQILGSET
jgi:hypothetical protein